MTFELNNSDDVIDIRDVIARFEELESEREDLESVIADDESDDAQTALTNWDDEHFGELELLRGLLKDLESYGGDEEWRGNSYPLQLIHPDYFTKYVRELLVDCGDIPADLPDYVEIDWDATADNVRVNYSIVDVDGVEYFYR